MPDQKKGTWEEELGGRRNSWDFSGGPGIKAPAAIARGVGSIPDGGTKIPACQQDVAKKEKKKKSS